MAAEMLQHLAHGPKPVRTAIKGVGALQHARLNTGFREIVGVDELVGILAVTEHRDVFPLVNPLEEDLKDSKPTMPTIVRGRTMVTSKPFRAYSQHRFSPASLALPYASIGVGTVSSVTGFDLGIP